MGEYIQAGLCYRVKVGKKYMENSRVDFQELLDGLSREISIDLYEIREVEQGYFLELKEEILEKGQLSGFLIEQYRLFNTYGDKSEDIFNRLKELNKANEIIEFAKEKPYEYFQYSSIYDNIHCGRSEKRLMIEYEMITFFMAGKIMMESYRKFLSYIEGLIKKDNQNKVSETVKVLIG